MTFNSFSQFGQDVFVANHFGWKRDGYFVDVGAWDGVETSNSYQMEKELGWKGICVEPLPTEFERLCKARSAICVNKAAYSTNGLELEFAQHLALSGIVKHIECTEALIGERIIVQTTTLATILRKHGAPSFIEYLSIDTEGSELEVLRGIDWAQHTFGFISVEHNVPRAAPEWAGVAMTRRLEMRRYLEERGYKYLRENGVDDDYVFGDQP